MAQETQWSVRMKATDNVIYRIFGKNWMMRLGAATTSVCTFIHFQFPPGSTPHRWAGVGIGVGAMLGQLGSIAPAAYKPDLPPEPQHP